MNTDLSMSSYPLSEQPPVMNSSIAIYDYSVNMAISHGHGSHGEHTPNSEACSSEYQSPSPLYIDQAMADVSKMSLSTRSLSRIQHRAMNENIINWLQQNYKFQEGICLPRCTLYNHYRDHMKRTNSHMEPIGAAGFGKLVRKTFPNITTRRLGTRGQSKYHYYGISIRETSIYFQIEKQKQQQQEAAKMYANNSNAEELAKYMASDYYSMNGFYPYARHFSYQQLPNSNFTAYQNTLANSIANHYGHLATTPQYPLPYSSASIKSTIASQINKKRHRTKMLINLRKNASPQEEATDYTVIAGQKYSAFEVYQSNDKTSITTSAVTIKSEPLDDFAANNASPMDFIAPSVTSTFAYFQQNFPSVSDFKPPPEDVPSQMLSTFLLMYQSHSQRILDTFQLANIEELEKTVTHFWSEMPPHLAQLLTSPFLLTIVECADSLLYRTIEDSLSQLSLLPEMSVAFVSDVETILVNMNQWFRCAILGDQSRMRSIISAENENGNVKSWHESKPVANQLYLLATLKMHLFDQFACAIRKLLEFFKIAKECRHRIMQPKYASLMIDDLNLIDEGLSRSFLDENGLLRQQQERMLFLGNTAANQMNACKDVSSSKSPSGQSDDELLTMFHRSFRQLLQALQKSIDFDQILRWARSVMEKCVITYKGSCLTSRSQTLLNAYTCYVLGVMRDMTINGAKSCDLWNLVFVCIKEFFLLETARHIRYEEQAIRRSALMRNEKQETVSVKPVPDYFSARKATSMNFYTGSQVQNGNQPQNMTEFPESNSWPAFQSYTLTRCTETYYQPPVVDYQAFQNGQQQSFQQANAEDCSVRKGSVSSSGSGGGHYSSDDANSQTYPAFSNGTNFPVVANGYGPSEHWNHQHQQIQQPQPVFHSTPMHNTFESVSSTNSSPDSYQDSPEMPLAEQSFTSQSHQPEYQEKPIYPTVMYQYPQENQTSDHSAGSQQFNESFGDATNDGVAFSNGNVYTCLP